MAINTNYFVSGVVINNKLYWTERDGGELCCYDFNKDMTLYDVDFEPEEFSAVLAHDEDCLLGVSRSGRFFWKYNVNNKVKKIYEIDCQNYALDWVMASKIIDDSLVILPSRAPYVVWINIRSGKVVIKDFNNEKIDSSEKIKFADDKVVVGQNEGNKISTLCCEDKLEIIVEQDKTINKVEYPEMIGEILDFYVNEDKKYVINEDGQIFYCDNSNKNWKLLSNDFRGYSRLFCYNKSLWIFPRGKGNIINLDREGNKNIYEYPIDVVWREDIIDEYLFYTNNYNRIEDKDKVIFTPFGCNYMIVFAKQQETINFVDYTRYDKDNLVDLFKKGYDLYYEGNKQLEYFISYIESI